MKAVILSFLAFLGPAIAVAASPQPVETGFGRGEVILQISNTPNYAPDRAPFPDPEGGYQRATLLTDGTLIVESERGRRAQKLSVRNVEEVERLATELYSVEVKRTEPPNGFMKPNSRKSLSVARRDWRTKAWSHEVRTVWLEDGCEYENFLEPIDPYDQMQVAVALARIEAIAFELSKE